MTTGEARIVELHQTYHFDERLVKHFNYFYQPQFDLNSGELKGFECLLRLIHPTKGIIGPADFIEQLNESSIWERLWPVMLYKIGAEQSKYTNGLKLSINVSPDELQQGDDSAFLKNFTEFSRLALINTECIEIEITEDFRIIDYEKVNSSIAKLKELGTSVVIDDFGAGFCNMNALDKLNVHGIKIDRSFIEGIESSELKQTIVKSLVEIAKVKNCYVVAEGIETSAQKNMVKHLGCEYGQGFLLGRPSPSFVHQIQF